MGRRFRTLLSAALVVAAALGLAGLQAPAASAAAQPMGECTTSSGVVVAVDLGHWGGPLLRACGTTPTTGYALLNQGGWHTTGTVHDGPGFVCRIGYDGYQGGTRYPTADDEACVATPPASKYWSYWHAGPGQHTWSYSQLGAMSYHPPAGSVELWTFGATNVTGTSGVPTISPDAVRATNAHPVGQPTAGPSSRPTATRTPSPTAPSAHSSSTGPAAGSAGSVAASTAAASGASGAATPSAGTSGPSSTSSPSAGAAGSDGVPSAGPSVVDAAPLSGSAPQQSSPSPLPLLLGLAVVAGVALLALAARWRRRSQSP